MMLRCNMSLFIQAYASSLPCGLYALGLQLWSVALTVLAHHLSLQGEDWGHGLGHGWGVGRRGLA